MHTPIGTSFDTPARRAAALAVALVIVASDLAGVWRSELARCALPVAALLAFALLGRRDRARSLGLRLSPAQGFAWWVRATLLIGLAVGAFVAVVVGVVLALRIRVVPPVLPPDQVGVALLHACVYAPLVEEGIYRLALCPPLAATFPPWATIAASGSVFAALHFIYGNPGADNFIAGYFLAWAYLKSGSLSVPIALHAVGNLCAVTAQVVAWYWIHS
jgi:membrane protease YdiL (CAAX protease family)